MGINTESTIGADIQIGPTTTGMVRIYVHGDDIDLPMDFDPDAAREIAEELIAAAQIAQDLMTKPSQGGKKRRRPG